MNSMTYSGYTARIEYDDEDEIFVGHLAGIRDIVSFHGVTVDELKATFHEAVDHYLAVCKERDEKPQKPYSGNLMLRVSADIHAAVATAAQVDGKSINQWASEVLDKASYL
ncbi:type II toxin-antitoxin system HicB family antitoxin [Myxococcota bacterium]|nr:type II toxin-antitoxin system HicB family antitoxin [Myxococcota bacterium]